MASSSNSVNKDTNKYKEPEVVLGSANDEMCIGRKNKGIAWAFCTDQGGREHMEDKIVTRAYFMSWECDSFGGCTARQSGLPLVETPIHYFAVFDGHGGSEVSDYCADTLHKSVEKAWRTEGFTHEWDIKRQSALYRDYAHVNNACERVLSGGSTAVVVLVSTCQIIAANCGDSRTILCRGSYTIPLTVDHKPDREDEEVRITNSGGGVLADSNVIMRVNGILAMSRAIGDKQLKPSVSSVPEFTFITRTQEDECLIIAGDGLSDVLSTEVVGEMACKLLQHERKVPRIDETLNRICCRLSFQRSACKIKH